MDHHTFLALSRGFQYANMVQLPKNNHGQVCVFSLDKTAIIVMQNFKRI